MGSTEPDQPSKSTVPKIHGLIIGINKYARSDVHPDLLGCVGDAQSMLRYFTDLGVPADNFLCLYNEHATRDAIIKAFVDDLIKNPKIKPLDPIVIYFAGHGDRMKAPTGWQTADGAVELILPHDASTQDKYGHYNYGIPDLTLAFLLYNLSQEKGNNITVILDSCHSGSGTRGEVRSRASHHMESPPVPYTLDMQLRKSLTVDYPSEIEHNVTKNPTQPSGKLMAPSLETHILLAACQNEELSQEVTNRDPISGDLKDPESSGVFTTALLAELRNCDLAKTSYTSLIRNLLAAWPKISATHDLSLQTFQCEGRNQDRLLFSIQNSTSKGKIALMPTSDKAVYRVKVGIAQRIVAGTEFGVFVDGMDPTSLPLATLVATDVGPITSHLQSQTPNDPPKIPPNAYATIIRYNDHSNGVRIWVDPEVKRIEMWQRIFNSLDRLPIFWATTREHHDVELFLNNGRVELRGAHLTPGQFGRSHILKDAPLPQQLAEMLTAIVYFHFHLKHQNKDAPVSKELSIALRELKEMNDSLGSTIYEVDGEDLFGTSVPEGTVATLHPDPKKTFGLEITNSSQENLFPYVLYYDFEDYSVGCLYEPPSRSGKAPLQAGKSMTIGYGSSGSPPFQVDFTNPRSDKEYGAFLLLVFSEWVDITYLQQESPLAALTFDGRGDRSTHPKTGVWDNIIVRVEMVKAE